MDPFEGALEGDSVGDLGRMSSSEVGPGLLRAGFHGAWGGQEGRGNGVRDLTLPLVCLF